MVWKIAKKEFLLNLMTFKFTVATIVSIALTVIFTPVLAKDYQQRLRAYHDNVARNEAERKAYAKYDQESADLDLECQRRLANRIRQLEQDYRNKRDVQAALAMNLSRISPVSCYTYLISRLSGTGLSEPERFVKNAQRYQEAVREAVYEKYIIKRYSNTTGSSATSVDYAEGFDPSNASLTEMYYRHRTLAEAFQAGWADILLLFLFNILFFAVAFLRFRKYDVR